MGIILFLIGIALVFGGGFLVAQAMSGRPKLPNVLPAKRELVGVIGIPIFMIGLGLIALSRVL